jgi:beta-glucosidase
MAMLDHYRRIVAGCHARGLQAMVTFNHYTTPRWFAQRGGWLHAGAPDLFARFCDRAARQLAAGIGHAMTLNEPNIMRVLRQILPEPVFTGQRAMLAAAARANGAATFTAGNAVNPEDIDTMSANLLAGHKAGRAAIKAARSELPVGVTLAMFDDQADGGYTARRDAMRSDLYGPWLEAVRGDDFLGVQNYERVVWGDNGRQPPPPGATLNYAGSEVYAPSLAGAVRYAHDATHLPILVSEHGVGTDDDTVRAALFPAALAGLHAAMADGVPVRGYMHWSLLDNFEWISGYRPKFGLFSVDRKTFRRTAKPSAQVYARIARANALS